MKKYIKQIVAFAFVAVALVSCSADDNTQLGSAGGNVILTTTSINRVDTNVDLNLKINTKAGVTASKIEVYNNVAVTTASATVPTTTIKLGTKFTDATIVDPTASAKFSSSVLTTNGVFNFPSLSSGVTPIQLAIVATYSDGSTTTNAYVLSVKAPVAK